MKWHKYINLDNIIKIMGLCTLVVFIVFICSRMLPTKTPSLQLAQVDLIKINNDYTNRAVQFILQINPQISEEQKMLKAQQVMQVVATCVTQLLNIYSINNKAIIIQKQVIASNLGVTVPDITQLIESQIDSRLNKDQLAAIAK